MASTKDATHRRRLGRGLGSLISTPVPIEIPAPPRVGPIRSSPAPASHISIAPPRQPTGDLVSLIDLKQIQPSPRQPRTRFDEAGLEALASSIRAAGVMQPIIVRPTKAGGFELIAGERRWRAAQRVGLMTIPAIVRELDDHTAAEWSLVENLQREDLNPIEQAEAFSRLVSEFGLTHQELAERVGLDRSTISNALRLNELDAMSKDALRAGRITTGHAKVLLAITNLEQRRILAEQAIRRSWSVRELEGRVRGATGGGAPAIRSGATTGTVAHVQDLERRLGAHLGTKVKVLPGRKKGAGKLIIEFFDLDQFEGLMQRIGFDTN